jgi:excisionase family DNA binding protein
MKSIEIQGNLWRDILNMADDFLTVERAAEVLHFHPVTVRRLLRAGQIPGRKIGARQWRISADALKAYIEGGELAPIRRVTGIGQAG